MKLRKALKNTRGETLVEVLISIVFFMMLLAVLSGAIQFSTNSQRLAGQIRENAAVIQRELRETNASGSGTDTYRFRAISADGTQEGNKVFEVDVRLQTKVVEDAQGREVTFYLFGTGGGP